MSTETSRRYSAPGDLTKPFMDIFARGKLLPVKKTSSRDGASLRNGEREINIQHYGDLKSSNGVWESPALCSREHFRYSLIFQPNGLKHTKSFNKAIGIWLKPLPSDFDDELDFPAKVTLAFRVLTDATVDGLSVTPTTCSWDREDTHSRYPVVAFAPTITHSAIEKAYSFEGGDVLRIAVKEI
jgi:hypothetical protein